jgi:hypothetical protein
MTVKTLIGNIKGPKGDTGEQGPKGDKGDTGATGATGATGPQGATGAKGDKGDTGATGATGAAGEKGSIWYTGTKVTGTSTTATVFSSSGITAARVEDMYLNTSTGNTYRCTTAGAASTAKWVYTGNIKGAAATLTYGTSATALGTSSAGSATSVSRSDHVHALPALTDCTGTLSVEKGGTGATNAAGALENLGALATNGDSKSNTTTFTTGDTTTANATSWTDVSQITSGLTHANLFQRISQMCKNVRYLYNNIGKIKGIIESLDDCVATTEDGYAASAKALSQLNSNILKYRMINVKGIGSDIITLPDEFNGYTILFVQASYYPAYSEIYVQSIDSLNKKILFNQAVTSGREVQITVLYI